MQYQSRSSGYTQGSSVHLPTRHTTGYSTSIPQTIPRESVYTTSAGYSPSQYGSASAQTQGTSSTPYYQTSSIPSTTQYVKTATGYERVASQQTTPQRFAAATPTVHTSSYGSTVERPSPQVVGGSRYTTASSVRTTEPTPRTASRIIPQTTTSQPHVIRAETAQASPSGLRYQREVNQSSSSTRTEPIYTNYTSSTSQPSRASQEPRAPTAETHSYGATANLRATRSDGKQSQHPQDFYRYSKDHGAQHAGPNHQTSGSAEPQSHRPQGAARSTVNDGEDVIEIDRHKIFDKLYEIQEKEEEAIEEQLNQYMLTLTAPPTEQQIETIGKRMKQQLNAKCKGELHRVFDEFAQADASKNTMSKDEFLELGRNYIICSQHRGIGEDQTPVGGLEGMLFQMAKGMMEKANETLHSKMLQNYQLIGTEVFKRLQLKDGPKNTITKDSFLTKFIPEWDSVCEIGMDKLMQSGELFEGIGLGEPMVMILPMEAMEAFLPQGLLLTGPSDMYQDPYAQQSNSYGSYGQPSGVSAGHGRHTQHASSGHRQPVHQSQYQSSPSYSTYAGGVQGGAHGYTQSGFPQGGYTQGGYSQGGYTQGGYSQGGYTQQPQGYTTAQGHRRGY